MSASADDPAARRADFVRALHVAEHDALAQYHAAARPLADHPLYPYLEYAHLRRQLDRVDAAQVHRFLLTHGDLPLADGLRRAWLHALIRRQDWTTYRRFHTAADSGDRELRCASLQAQLSTGMDAGFFDQALATWLDPASLPPLCDAAIAALRAAGRLGETEIWRRIELAADAGNDGLMRHLARSLPPAQRVRAEAFARFVLTPDAALTAGWTDDVRSRAVISAAIARLAQRDADAAEALHARLAARFAFDTPQRERMLGQIALWSAASYLPSAAARLDRLSSSAFDTRLHEWHAREALSRLDFARARRAIAAMPASLRSEPRWRWFEARAAEALGDTAAAQAAFQALAGEAHYHGFLAADRLAQPYALCPLRASAQGDAADEVRAVPGIARALELHAIGREGWARREWERALATLEARLRPVAVAVASRAGWRDRGAFTLREGDELRYYSLRFPLPHSRHVREQARQHDLDPAWVAALIRAESGWIADARSHADARGLMQLLPSTARSEARRLGLPWKGPASLFEPIANITLGTAHLARMRDEHGGRTHLATAAYNAGATPVARWLAQRPALDTDLWIETIPYRETREYVARILAFSVIYDWRLGESAVPILKRARGDRISRADRRGFQCPVPLPVASVP